MSNTSVDSMVNVRMHGALGDGLADDTDAIRGAIAALPEKGGVLYFPAGHYLTDTMYVPSHTTVLGHSAFGYGEAGGAVISPAKPFQARLIDLNGKRGTRLVGLSLHGKDLGEDMTGVFTGRGGGHEQGVVIDACRIEHFSGSGVAMNESHVFSIRHSILMHNRLDGLDANSSFDGWLCDTQFVANGRYGIQINNSVAITGNRIEHNGRAGISFNRHFSQHVQVTGNLFCSEHGPALEMLEGNIRSITVTGNTFRNSGRSPNGDAGRDCHVRLEGVRGLTFTGNSLNVLWCNNPSCGMQLKGLVDSVVANNTMYRGATKELIRDLGGHRNSVIENNPGCLKELKDID